MRAWLALLAAALIVWGAPLLGLALAGQPLAPYLEFPPRTRFVEHAAFSWVAFAICALPALAAASLYAVGLARAKPARTEVIHRYPWWGWLGVLLVALGWALAWNDVSPPEWRRHTFTPLWLGYILSMNALAFRRSGRSPLTHRTAWLLALFPASAVFWWLFEYLNRYVGNWYYTGVVDSGDWDYFLQGTLPFSTVLPAVMSTTAWLATFPRLDALSLPALRGAAVLPWTALAIGTLALFGIGLWPDELFAMLWLAPLLVLAGLQRLVAGASLFSPLARGDWRPLLLPALAALVCGLLWEMWNWGSSAQWHYSVPYVQRFHVFEMPLLGYAGYLPFGVECALVAQVYAGGMGSKGSSSYGVAFVRKPGYLHAVVTGQNSRENVLRYLEDVRRECAAAGCARVLIEERLEGPRLDLMQVFQVASLQGRLPENVPTIAYVDVNSVGPSMAFAEDVAVNRGLNVRVFDSVADAEQWLRDLA